MLSFYAQEQQVYLFKGLCFAFANIYAFICSAAVTGVSTWLFFCLFVIYIQCKFKILSSIVKWTLLTQTSLIKLTKVQPYLGFITAGRPPAVTVNLITSNSYQVVCMSPPLQVLQRPFQCLQWLLLEHSNYSNLSCGITCTVYHTF